MNSGNFIQQLNCKTNNSRNLQLINGCLAIAAIREKHLDRDYTSALITSKESFTFGRFVLRAALARGKMLRPAIWMAPTSHSGDWPKDGQIDVLTNVQTKSLGNGIHYLTQKSEYHGPEYKTNSNLNDFHTYVVEWNESTIVWKFDERAHLVINISEKLLDHYNPFASPFKLVLTLGVGGQFFINQVLTLDDVYDWDCSLFLLDYIRVYRWTKSIANVSNSSRDSKDRQSATDLCAAIMPSIRPERPLDIPLVPIVAVLCLLLLVILIPLVIYLFIRQKKVIRHNIEGDEGVYDDYNGNEYYESVDKDNNEEYADPYQKTNTNYYSEIDIQKEQNDNYLQLTNSYITRQ